MSWRWPWRRSTRLHTSRRAGHRRGSGAVWWDLIRPDAALARAAEVAARNAAELAALERVLNEPTMVLELGVRVPPFVVPYRWSGWLGVRRA